MKFYIFFLIIFLISCQATLEQDLNKDLIISKDNSQVDSSKNYRNYTFDVIKYTNQEGHRVVTTGFGLLNNIDSIKNLKLIDLEIWNDSSLTHETFNQISSLNNIKLLRIHLYSARRNYIRGLDKLQNIKTLEIVYFTEDYIEDLNKLQNLKNLTLDIPQIKEFPSTNLYLPNLITFQSIIGEIQTISPEIQKMQNLKSIIFSKNKIKTIPVELSNLKKLETLMIGGTWSIDSIPDELALLENLHTLNLFRNNLSYIPKGIINLKNLKSLNIDNNKLSKKQADSIKVLLPNCEVTYYP